MGYDLHITRRDPWFEESGPEITAAEWEAAVAADPGLVMLPEPRTGTGGRQWTAGMTGQTPRARQGTALWWTGGEVRAKNPSDLLIQVMCRVARALDARVQGDDGEHYL